MTTSTSFPTPVPTDRGAADAGRADAGRADAGRAVAQLSLVPSDDVTPAGRRSRGSPVHWRLDDRTVRQGRAGVAEARRALLEGQRRRVA